MSTNKSEHYDLHLWEPEDTFVRAEFNENSTKVDEALHGLETGKAKQSDMTALQTTVGKKADQTTVSALQTAVDAKADKTALAALQQTVNTKGDKVKIDHLYELVYERASIAVGTYTGNGQSQRHINAGTVTAKAALVEQQSGMRSYTTNAGSLGGLAVRGGDLINRGQVLVEVNGTGFYVYNRAENIGSFNTNGVVYHYIVFR